MRFFSFIKFRHPNENALAWANNVKFPPASGFQDISPGYVVKICFSIYLIHNNGHLGRLDPLIGQGTSQRTMSGLYPLDEKHILTLEEFVVPKGGEYFFSPSLDALEKTIGKGLK